MSNEYSVVEALLEEYNELQTIEKDINEHIEASCAQELEKLQGLQDQIRDLTNQMDGVRASMQEREYEAFSDLAKIKKELERKETSVKQACYGLPIDLVRKGKVLNVGRFRVSIAKASTKVTYSEELIDDHPEYFEMYVDGEPLIKRVIDANIMDRLVASGSVEEEDVAPYRTEVKVRNPAVRITEYVE